MTEPLFDMTPNARLQRGDKVRIQTIWGTEFCDVEKVATDDNDFPMVQLRTQSGDQVFINIARAQKVEDG